MPLTELGQDLFERRYRATPEETWEDACIRVAHAVAPLDEDLAHSFFDLMYKQRFLPNSPTLMNAGRVGTLSGCFTLVPDDSMDSIIETGQIAAQILKFGGGVGYGLSRLREFGAPVASTGGKARGPLAALQYYQAIGAFVEQAGRRNGAQMGMLHCDHPDLAAFIDIKNEDPQRLDTFNLSVAATDDWMKRWAVESSLFYRAEGNFLQKVALSAWKTGDPGLFFIDRAERDNPTPHLGKLESTNPCGEVPLLPNESCNLGSINLAAYYAPPAAGHSNKGTCNTSRLEEDVRLAVRFLDGVITANKYPHPTLAVAALRTRKIGLGVMGYADLLALMGLPYGTQEAVALGSFLAVNIREWADDESVHLAEEQDCYPAQSLQGVNRRNATRLCIAPTGSIAILAGCSAGIEPHFAMGYTRLIGGEERPITEPIVAQIHAQPGSSISELPPVAHEIAPEWHIQHQAAWQEHVDLAVSKTINLPNDATVKDIYDCYVEAWKAGCKGVTVFRDGCRGDDQVLKASTPHPSSWRIVASRPEDDARQAKQEEQPQSRIKRTIEAIESLNSKLQKKEQTGPATWRDRLPARRPAETFKFEVGGEEGYATFGYYPDEAPPPSGLVTEDATRRPGELFLTLNKAGSAARGWADLCATFVSIMLQHGIPIAMVVTKLRGTRFEPAGLTGDPRIPAASSIPDYLGHLMELEFMGENTATVVSGEMCPDCGGTLVHRESCLTCLACGYERC